MPTPAANRTDLPADLSRPTQRAFAAAGITSLADVARRSEAELLALHGVGPKTIRQLRPVLAAAGLDFAPAPAKRSRRAV